MLASEPALVQALSDAIGAAITAATPVSGGCIAQATRLQTERGVFFLKWGRGAVAKAFAGEAAGLEALAKPDTPLRIPKVYSTQEYSTQEETDTRAGYLLMEWIEPGAPDPTFDADLGEALAYLHRHTADTYGFEVDNHIGKLPQQNPRTGDWPTFFREHRLRPQAERARTQGRWKDRWNAPFATVLEGLDRWLPQSPRPALVHGDLWRGNVMATQAGGPALVDPATYYGHREVDLAMADLFGGFDEAFYAAYRSVDPLSAGYSRRASIYNLYHLINHLNHFGGAYAQQVEHTMQEIVS